ncbi:hypothetical protein [Cupriavidus sp. DL-D2]|uniref:hypothetical protein n=1 Tax=Cupriavidus sp. DL-D2 TaxID=3144974 RepID=UPI0032153CB2
MADLSTTIDGYRVDLEILTTTGCWINYKAFSASLEVLMGMGVLTSGTGQEHNVPTATIDKIEAWALTNGY